MSFLRQAQIYQSDAGFFWNQRGRSWLRLRPRPHRLDESAAGYSLAGCSPAEPASASPASAYFGTEQPRRTIGFQRTAKCGLTGCLSRGVQSNLAYHASCLEEEGRFPRFRIVAGTNWDSRHCVRFGPFPKYVNEVKDLRKLAPAAAFRGSALVFGEERVGGEHARLICRGIYDTEDLISVQADTINSIEDFLIMRESVIAIRVEGPAYVKASVLPGPVFSLRGGSIRQLNPMGALTCVQELFAEVGQWQHAQLPEGDDKRVRTFFQSPDVLGRLMAKMWSRVLWHVSDRRRGGAFVIVPTNKGHWRHLDQFDIAVSYRANINYGKTLIDQVVSCLQMTPPSGAGFGDIFRLTWDRSRGERERITRMVADLANVDGCVVLDRRLNVIGFGGKITLPVKHMEGFGTRHGSANAWCSEFGGGMAFVVSQDGDLRVFSSGVSSPDAVDAGASVLEFC